MRMAQSPIGRCETGRRQERRLPSLGGRGGDTRSLPLTFEQRILKAVEELSDDATLDEFTCEAFRAVQELRVAF